MKQKRFSRADFVRLRALDMTHQQIADHYTRQGLPVTRSYVSQELRGLELPGRNAQRDAEIVEMRKTMGPAAIAKQLGENVNKIKSILRRKASQS